jgi:hypothetical protein
LEEVYPLTASEIAGAPSQPQDDHIPAWVEVEHLAVLAQGKEIAFLL